MNEMARPNAAARLSEDIGDVLSSIRRLIAEDEATGVSRPLRSTMTEARPAARDPDETLSREDSLARRFGGNAALARDMVAAHRRAEPVLRAPRLDAQDEARPDEIFPRRVVRAESAVETPPDAPSWRPAGDTPASGNRTSTTQAMTSAILRLEAADRLIPSRSTDAAPDASVRPGAAIPWRSWQPVAGGSSRAIMPDPAAARPASPPAAATDPSEQNPAPIPFFDIDALVPRIMSASSREEVAANPAEAQTDLTQTDVAPASVTSEGVTRGEDEDDFAEQFDAIARQQQTPSEPDPSMPAASPLAFMHGPAALTASRPAAQTAAEPTPSPAMIAAVQKAPSAVLSVAPAAARPMAPYPSLAHRVAGALRGRPIAAPRPAEPTGSAGPAPTSPRPGMTLPGLAATAAAPAAEAAVAVGASASTGETAADPAAQAPGGPIFSVSAPVRTTVEPLVPSVDEIVEAPALRALVREIIGEELHGELGTRFARNLRAVIRREVAAAIEDQMDRF